MNIEVNPIKIQIDVSTETTTRDGFFTPCFIAETENDFPRTSVVTSLEDVIDLGFDDESNCYSYCNTLFAQTNNTIDQVVIRAKYPSETYLESFLSDDNSSFFYVTIESKELQDIIDISDYIETIRKILIFSTNQDWSVDLEGRKNLIYIFDDEVSEFIYSAFTLQWINNNTIAQFNNIDSSFLDTITDNINSAPSQTGLDMIPQELKQSFPNNLSISTNGNSLIYSFSTTLDGFNTVYGIKSNLGQYDELITFNPEIEDITRICKLSPNGEYLFIRTLTEQLVYVKTITDDYEFLTTTSLILGYFDVAFSPDSTKFSFVDSNNFLRILETDGGFVNELYFIKISSNDSTTPDNITWIDNNNIIISINEENTSYYINRFDISTEEIIRTTVDTFDFRGRTSCSSDGSKIECHFNNNITIFDYDIPTNTVSNKYTSTFPTLLANQEGYISPNGEMFAICAFTELDFGISVYTINPNNSLSIRF